jgi:hypothetical protein
MSFVHSNSPHAPAAFAWTTLRQELAFVGNSWTVSLFLPLRYPLSGEVCKRLDQLCVCEECQATTLHLPGIAEQNHRRGRVMHRSALGKGVHGRVIVLMNTPSVDFPPFWGEVHSLTLTPVPDILTGFTEKKKVVSSGQICSLSLNLHG